MKRDVLRNPGAGGGGGGGVPSHLHDAGSHEIMFVGYPKLLFTYPLILAGYIFAFFAGSLNESGLETLGWVYVTILLLVVLTLGVDVGRNQAIFWVVVIFALWILGMWLKDARQIPVFSTLYGWFDAINVSYSRGLGLAISIVLTIPFGIMIAWAHLNDRWRITHNEFEHYSWGKLDDSLGRGAKTIRTEFPDVFEMLLAGAGTLIVYNAGGTQEMRRIPHVMFLPMVRKRLNKILETVAVTQAVSEEEEVNP
jgi:hypothetical protein